MGAGMGMVGEGGFRLAELAAHPVELAARPRDPSGGPRDPSGGPRIPPVTSPRRGKVGGGERAMDILLG